MERAAMQATPRNASIMRKLIAFGARRKTPMFPTAPLHQSSYEVDAVETPYIIYGWKLEWKPEFELCVALAKNYVHIETDLDKLVPDAVIRQQLVSYFDGYIDAFNLERYLDIEWDSMVSSADDDSDQDQDEVVPLLDVDRITRESKLYSLPLIVGQLKLKAELVIKIPSLCQSGAVYIATSSTLDFYNKCNVTSRIMHVGVKIGIGNQKELTEKREILRKHESEIASVVGPLKEPELSIVGDNILGSISYE
jgi:hypothetical protein